MIRLFLVFVLLQTPVCLHAASFDCSKARTSIEKAICSSPELSAADDKLAQAYHVALTKVPEAAMLVREAQRKWLLSAEQKCSHMDTNYSISHANPNYSISDCLFDAWTDRTYFLSQISVRMGGVPFFFREISLGKPCDEEDFSTGLAKPGPQTGNSKDSDSDRDSCAIHATWPEAISNAPQWHAWNKALLDEARRFNASQDNVNEIPDHWVRFTDPTWHSDDLDVSVDLDCVSPTLVAATINRTYTYAHPALQERAFNWLLKHGRELKQDDLFRPNSGWETWIKMRVAQIVKEYEITELKSQPSEAEEIAASAADVTVEPRYWRIGSKGLNLIFTQDELGYLTAVMMPDVTLSWSDLKPYLNPTFEIPR
ncbi:MAG: lysozyme inhibitor LprI family protein [Terracidiphilus sp.]